MRFDFLSSLLLGRPRRRQKAYITETRIVRTAAEADRSPPDDERRVVRACGRGGRANRKIYRDRISPLTPLHHHSSTRNSIEHTLTFLGSSVCCTVAVYRFQFSIVDTREHITSSYRGNDNLCEFRRLAVLFSRPSWNSVLVRIALRSTCPC